MRASHAVFVFGISPLSVAEEVTTEFSYSAACMVLVITGNVLNSGIRNPDCGDDILDAYNSTPKAKVRFCAVTTVLCGMF
jgi:hypothetical protein